MRPIWSGAISFGLVNIPVGLYPATSRQQRVELDLLRDSDHSRIRYKKVAEADGAEVPKEHIVKGYEYEKGNYVVLTEEDFKKVEIKSNQTIDIKEFTELQDIEPRFFNTPYFVAPLKGGAKAFALLREALEQTGLAGIAKVVIRPPREHLAVLKPLGDTLVLETLHFADELRDPSELPEHNVDVGKKELDMALALVKSMTGKWQPKEYRDEYREGLMKLIEGKVHHGASKPATGKPAQARGGKVIDLVELLQESLKGSKKEKPSGARAKAPRKGSSRRQTSMRVAAQR